MLKFIDEGTRIVAVFDKNETPIGIIVPHVDGGYGWQFGEKKWGRVATQKEAEEEIIRCLLEWYDCPQFSSAERVTA